MADFHKPSSNACDAYPTAYPTPVETVIHVDHLPGDLVFQPKTTEQGIMIGAWSADFWGCCDAMVPNCLMVTFYPCVSLAQISDRLNVARYGRVLVFFSAVILAEFITVAHMYSRSNAAAMSYRSASAATTYDDHDTNSVESGINTILRAIVFAYVWHLRQTTRRMFKLPGSACGDCWASLCCFWCTLTQIATHIKSYKPGGCSFGPADVLPSYSMQ